MKIESIRVKNFKVFRDLNLSGLSPLNVFLGANGVGKSTLFKVFGFLSDALRNNVTVAINREGGYREVLTRGCIMDDPISFEIQFRAPDEQNRSPLVTYELAIGWHQGKAVVLKEVLRYRRGSHGKPFDFLKFERGQGDVITNEREIDQGQKVEEREHQVLESSDILAIKGFGQLQRYPIISSFRKLLEGWVVSSLQNDALRTTNDVGADQHLSASGNNLPQVTQFIHDQYPEVFQQILTKMEKRVPGVEKVEAVPNDAGQILLKFKDGAFVDPFVSRYVSDGTLKMFAYLVLLHDPSPHPLLCSEEPENYLYPTLLSELAMELREYSQRGGQVFVSTHSPDFVNALHISELFLVRKTKGTSSITRATDDPTLKALFEAGNNLGYLWQQNLIPTEGDLL